MPLPPLAPLPPARGVRRAPPGWQSHGAESSASPEGTLARGKDRMRAPRQHRALVPLEPRTKGTGANEPGARAARLLVLTLRVQRDCRPVGSFCLPLWRDPGIRPELAFVPTEREIEQNAGAALALRFVPYVGLLLRRREFCTAALSSVVAERARTTRRVFRTPGLQ